MYSFFLSFERRLATIANHPPQGGRQIVDGASIAIFGSPMLIQVAERAQHRGVTQVGNTLIVRGTAEDEAITSLVERWLRSEMRERIQAIVATYEPVMGVKVAEIGIRQMKTRWGTCNIAARRIWLNLELGWLDPVYLEYVVVHEMVHLLERGHNRRFYGFMDRFQPAWKARRRELRAIGIRPR